MPRRTYNRREGRMRPFHGASTEWLDYIRRLVTYDRPTERNAR